MEWIALFDCILVVGLLLLFGWKITLWILSFSALIGLPLLYLGWRWVFGRPK